MRLYFSPLACSLAPRIALYEAGAEAEYVQVDRRAKRCVDGSDYRAINPLGQVPALVLDDGALLTECAAILTYIAERYPHAELLPTDARERALLQQWMAFVGTELHKLVYAPHFDDAASDAVREYALAKAPSRLEHVANRLEGREHVMDRFGVADVYLFTILNWTRATPLDLASYPPLAAFHARMLTRPHVARATREEYALYTKS